MTPQEFADAHGLTLEEAELILAKRRIPSMDPNSRLARARAKLEATQKRVGVQPVSAEGDELVKGYDPDADVGKVRFYEKQNGVTLPRVTKDPDGWEEPP